MAVTRDVSVVICAYTEDRWGELVAAVESIQRQSMSPCETILVIDHNLQLFKRAQAHITGVSVMESSAPKGLSGARNSGIAKARGTFIAFLDDDAVAEPYWLERLENCCQDEQVLGAGGVVYPLWSGKRPVWFPQEFYWVVGCSFQKQLDVNTIVRNPYGGCTCIRREVFEKMGGFRIGIGRIGNLPFGGEETELCIRALQHWPHRFFLCNPHARILHHISLSRASWRYFIARCFAEGLSKAAITILVGAKDGLISEREYICKILPKGIVRGIKDFVFDHDPTGLMRAGAIIIGFLVTTIGYLVGIATRRTAFNSSSNCKNLAYSISSD